MHISGSCHCGNIAFELVWQPPPTHIPARACSCSFCTAHGGVWTSCPTGSIRIAVKHRAQLSSYSFATKSADFLICRNCGVVPVVTSRIEARLYAVVNVNTFIGIEPALLQRSPVTHEGESEATRLARRKRNWIAEVSLQYID
jgi:hypothetical protein